MGRFSPDCLPGKSVHKANPLPVAWVRRHDATTQEYLRQCALKTVPTPRVGKRFIAGTSSEYVRVGDEGSRIRFHFCPHCGATVYYEPEGTEEYLAIPVGAFADPSFPAPSVSVYEERMHAWVVPPADAQHIP